MAVDPLDAVRDIALAFPEATERETWGHPTFRVRDKIFVTFGDDAEAGTYLTMKAAAGEQESLLAEGEPFFFPKYVGSKGWIGVRVGANTDWNAIAELILDSYMGIAPKSLATGVGVASERSATARAVVGVGNVIGELVENKPVSDPSVVIAEADDDDSGFDPDDPSSSSITI